MLMLNRFTKSPISPKLPLRCFSTSHSAHTSNMWKYQEMLQRFPVPPLEETLSKFKQATKALLNEEDFKKYSEVIDQFGAKDGPELQRLLQGVDKEAPYNWMEGYWQSMYLDLRCPMPINVNPFLVLGDDPNPKKNYCQINKAASLIAATARFALSVQREQLEPDMAGDIPLCMNGYTKLFGGTRIPKHGRDEFVVSKNPRHVVVFCLNTPYRLDIIKEDSTIVPEKDLVKNLRSIRDHAHKFRLTPDSIFPVGLLTTENRDTWALLKNQISGISELNRKNLEEIDSALFVVCLDEQRSRDLTEFSKLVFYGNANNRYYDKLQMIIGEDGQAAFNMEHTGYDGQVLARFMIDMHADAINKDFDTPKSSEEGTSPEPLFLKTNPPVRAAISKADASWNDFVSVTDIEILNFNDYGKNRIKLFKIPPDAYFQAAAQIATKRTFGRLVSTYESSSVRNYAHGRTETIRPLTLAMKTFVDKFEDPKVSSSEKIEAFQNAATGHQGVVKASKTGQGIDRHLQGLYWTSLQKAWRMDQYKINKFFTDGNYSNYMSNRLSTSNVGGDLTAVKLFGFGAVHGEGVGLGYLVNSDSLVMSITSYTNNALKWKLNMEQVLREIPQIFEKSTKSK